MAKTSGPRKEIDNCRSGIFKSDAVLAYRTEGDEYACVTPRPAPADGPAVVDQVDVEPLSCPWRDDRLVQVMCWLLSWRNQSEPTEDPRDMRVNRERVPVQRVRHDTPRGLLANTWKRHEEGLYFIVSHLMEVLEGEIAAVAVRDHAALPIVLQDGSEERLEVRSPLRLEASGPQHALQFGRRGCRNVEPSGVLASEASEDTLVDGLAGVQAEQDVHDLRENVINVSQVS